MRINQVLGGAIIGALFLLLAITCRAAFLDGTRSKVKVVPDKVTADRGEKEYTDTLSFSKGKFSSKTFLARGFKPADYRGESEENEAEFEVEQTSDTNGVVTWQGEIRAKKVLGRLTWKKKDGTSLSYDFDGSKQ
ncbi:MAG TPA: hypothetical protein VNL17_03005 [Verrucomicrobiae bacterium]|nr:hypothetical protein [Verrucomicrobiae bacterium]